MKRVSRTTDWRRRKARSRMTTACCARHQGIITWSSSDEEARSEEPTFGVPDNAAPVGVRNDDGESIEGGGADSDRDNPGENTNQSGDSGESEEDDRRGDNGCRHPDGGGGDGDPHDSSSGEDSDEDEEDDSASGGDDEPYDGSNDEEDNAGNEAENNMGPQEPDDPDDPHDSGDSDFNNDSDDDLCNFSFNRVLNRACESANRRSVREVFALVLALSSRHSITYEALINMMKLLNVVHSRPIFPVDKKALWSWLGRRSLGIAKTVYCPKCLVGHGSLRHLQAVVHCNCGHQILKQTCKFFISLDIKSQLRELLQRQDVKAAMGARPQRNLEGMTDIIDGHHYRLLQTPGNILQDNNNFSYTFSTDGFRLAKSSSAEAWPLYMRWSELPWKLRQRYIILAGVWVELQHPNMNLFLERFVEQANDLSANGILWSPAEGREVRSKFIPTCCVVDSQARWQMLNSNSPVGYSCCPLCNHRGLNTGNGVHYPHPVIPGGDIPIPVRRTDDSIKANMIEATRTGNMVEGFRGASQLMLMNYLDLGVGIVTDDLHPFSGVIKDHLEILLSRIEGQQQQPRYYIGTPRSMALIDQRLGNIKTPTHLSRKPRPLKTRKRWHGSEWRNFLLYYLVPVLDGILPNRYLRHFQLLAQAVFLVSRDVVTQEDCDVAQELFDEYVTKFERYFGREHMVHNVHILLHVSECVKNWGPIYAHSTTFFESWNHDLLKTVTSPHATADQIVTRFFMWRFLNNIEEDQHISAEVKHEIRRLLDNPRLREPVIIADVHLLGKSIERQPSQQELHLLENNNECANNFVQYKRARFNGMEFRCAGYRYAGAETKSDNSQIYTVHDEFCQIITIAAFGNNMARRVAIFCKIYVTNDNVNRYVSKVAEGDEVLVLKYFEDVRSLAIMCTTASGVYIMPVANTQELD